MDEVIQDLHAETEKVFCHYEKCLVRLNVSRTKLFGGDKTELKEFRAALDAINTAELMRNRAVSLLTEYYESRAKGLI